MYSVRWTNILPVQIFTKETKTQPQVSIITLWWAVTQGLKLTKALLFPTVLTNFPMIARFHMLETISRDSSKLTNFNRPKSKYKKCHIDKSCNNRSKLISKESWKKSRKLRGKNWKGKGSFMLNWGTLRHSSQNLNKSLLTWFYEVEKVTERNRKHKEIYKA